MCLLLEKARIARVEINQSKLVADPDRCRIHEDVEVEAERAEAPLVIRTEEPLALRRLEFLAVQDAPGERAVLTVDGVGVCLNRSHAAHEEKTGSLVGLAAVTSNAILLDDTWFDLEVVRRAKLAQVRVDGILVAQAVVPERSGKSAVTLQRHDAATVVVAILL